MTYFLPSLGGGSFALGDLSAALELIASSLSNMVRHAGSRGKNDRERELHDQDDDYWLMLSFCFFSRGALLRREGGKQNYANVAEGDSCLTEQGGEGAFVRNF